MQFWIFFADLVPPWISPKWKCFQAETWGIKESFEETCRAGFCDSTQ